MSKVKQRGRLIGLALAVLLLAFSGYLIVVLNSLSSREYNLGFEKLRWAEVLGCRLELSDAHSFKTLSRTVSWSKENPANQAHCISEWFSVRGNSVEFEYAAYANVDEQGRVRIEVEEEGQGIVALHTVPGNRKEGVWKLFSYTREAGAEQLRVRVHLIDQASGTGWLALRNRVNFYQLRLWEKNLRRVINTHPRIRLLFFVFSVLLVFVALSCFGQSSSALVLISVYFFSALFIHYRADSFFHMDTWGLLKRFHEHGLAGALISHNEHFIPIFGWFYYLEFLLFASHYRFLILISLLLHAINGFLLAALLRRILAPSEHLGLVSSLLGLLYVSNALNSEVLHWAMCQCILLCVTAMLCCLIAAWDYLETEKRSSAVLFFVAALAAPLCFGAGFLLLAEIPLLFLLFFGKSFFGQSSSDCRQRVLRGARMIPLFLAPFVISGLLYLVMRRGEGHGLDHVQLPQSWLDSFHYSLFGSQFGTLFRGLGFYPFRETNYLEMFLPGLLSHAFNIETIAIFLGLSLSMLIFLYYLLRPKERGFRLLLFLVGQGFLTLPFVLVSLGRTRYGLEQALALRYDTISLLGVCLIIAPLVQDLVGAYANRRLTEGSLWRRSMAYALPLLLIVFLFSQLSFSRSYTFYWKSGYLMRNFVSQVLDWNERLARVPFDPQIPYEGAGTDYHGLYPLLYGRSPRSPSAIRTLVHPDTKAVLLGR